MSSITQKKIGVEFLDFLGLIVAFFLWLAG